MEDQLILAVDAHGGVTRWDAIQTVTAELTIGGALWDIKGKTGILKEARYEADVHVQRATLSRFTAPDRRVQFSPERLVLETESGELIDTRDRPRLAFEGHAGETPWDDLQVAYFSGYAMWMCLTQPFLYAYAGFETEEIDPWEEDGEIWRRLKVIFPDHIASHTRQQVTYFGPDGLMRRHDYAVDVLGGATGAHYVWDYRVFNGIAIPTRHRVFALGPNNQPVAQPVLVSIDVKDARFF
jgi:hypothetical protein